MTKKYEFNIDNKEGYVYIVKKRDIHTGIYHNDKVFNTGVLAKAYINSKWNISNYSLESFEVIK